MNVVLFFHSLWGNGWLNSVMVYIAEYGLLVSGAAFVAAVTRRHAYQFLPGAMVGGAIAIVLDLVGGHLIVHPRPFVVLGLEPLLAHSPDNSFPSDHSAVAAYLAATLWFVDIPMALISTVAAIAIGIARVYCLLHWSSDIAGGWLIGAVPAILVGLWFRKRRVSPVA